LSCKQRPPALTTVDLHRSFLDEFETNGIAHFKSRSRHYDAPLSILGVATGHPAPQVGDRDAIRLSTEILCQQMLTVKAPEWRASRFTDDVGAASERGQPRRRAGSRAVS